MRYTYNCNDGLNTDKSTNHIQAMSYKKMLKILPLKYPIGTIVNVSYTNKKKNLIIKDIKVVSNDWNIYKHTKRITSINFIWYSNGSKRVS